MQPGDKVRLIDNPSRIGILGNEVEGPPHRQRILVTFFDGREDFLIPSSLEKVESEENFSPYNCILNQKFGTNDDLRSIVTFYRLSGKLSNIIYSLNTTNTQFFSYQFKPVLQFLESPCNGILIADEVGLGKTIEAGLIWTELRARFDAKRLLVIAPAMLRLKWKKELKNRFGVNAEIVDAAELLNALKDAKSNPKLNFALVASMQGLRPPRDYEDAATAKSAAAQLARFLENDLDLDASLIDMIIVDEAHYLRNRKTQTNKLGGLLRGLTSNLVLLSATPIQMGNSDLFNLLHLLDEHTFAYEESFRYNLAANEPLVVLRDKVLSGVIDPIEFEKHIKSALSVSFLRKSEQLNFMLKNLPTKQQLMNPKDRAEIADFLDRVNPLSNVVCRTLKRDVQNNRVIRVPRAIKVNMSLVEEDFYIKVTSTVRDFCSKMNHPPGFIVTLPQRQMSSCMAAACFSWRKKALEEKIVQTSFEVESYDDEDGFNESALNVNADSQPLLTALESMVNDLNLYENLKANDEKYKNLLNSLKRYWKEPDNKNNKVVLFAFYRGTLDYLNDRLQEDGIESIVLYGGLDKEDILNNFFASDKVKILLSSEVASEGVDLQFSSVLVNYDLPWNPMRIEQRIGRIDRIGQQADRIFIWNFMYSQTLDELVYDRLLERLNVFNRALGYIEGIVGEPIMELTNDLFMHHLSREEEEHRVNQTALAIENMNRQQEVLESNAVNLIAHGEFIQSKVQAAKELGRYIRGEDLLNYARDFLEENYKGTRFIESEHNNLEFQVEFSVSAKIDLLDFLERNNYFSGKQLIDNKKRPLFFENRHGEPSHKFERITQDHPLIRFVTEKIEKSKKKLTKFPIAAIELPVSKVKNLKKGIYVFAIHCWQMSGAREVESLEYAVKYLDESIFIDKETAEHLINTVTLEGSHWLGVSNELDSPCAALAFSECRDELSSRFDSFRAYQCRENKDRLDMMKSSLKAHFRLQRERLLNQIDRHYQSGSEKHKRLIPALQGKLKKMEEISKEKEIKLDLKADMSFLNDFVSGGVVRLV